jgi:hypothetical protein
MFEDESLFFIPIGIHSERSSRPSGDSFALNISIFSVKVICSNKFGYIKIKAVKSKCKDSKF